jgi:hypothetical protein
MINFYNQVPSVYPNASRDFQYVSWLVNIVLNAVKHNVDDIYNLPDTNSDPRLTELLAMTLGFKVKRNYDKKQLTALVAILPSILKYKGTEKAIKMAAEALVMASGSLGDTSTSVDGTEITVVIPKDLDDITLFLDLLDYILPAGMTCRVIRRNETKKRIDNIELKHHDILNLLVAKDIDWDSYDPRVAGLSSLYPLGDVTEHEFLANLKKLGDELVLNPGLINNTIIPVLANGAVTETGDTVDLFAAYLGKNRQLFDENWVPLKAKKNIKDL